MACLGAAVPFWAALLFFLRATDPGPSWWQWLGGFISSAIALWIYSFPARTAIRCNRRYFQIQRMWTDWNARAERGEFVRKDAGAGPRRGTSV